MYLIYDIVISRRREKCRKLRPDRSAKERLPIIEEPIQEPRKASHSAMEVQNPDATVVPCSCSEVGR